MKCSIAPCWSYETQRKLPKVNERLGQPRSRQQQHRRRGRGGSSVSFFKTTLFSKNVGEYIFPKLGNLDLDYQMGRGNSITYILTYLLVLHSTDRNQPFLRKELMLNFLRNMYLNLYLHILFFDQYASQTKLYDGLIHTRIYHQQILGIQ